MSGGKAAARRAGLSRSGRKYVSLFKIRFQNGMQYRAAAWAGVFTQFIWGFMYILLYSAFYRADPASFPMAFEAMVSYVWLKEAFLALFSTFIAEYDILDLIRNGNIAYELCRPVELYSLWFVKAAAGRISMAVLRCFPILIVAVFLPKPYGLSLPPNAGAFGLFLISMALGLLVAVGFTQIVYILCFHTISPQGIRILFSAAVDILSGALLPLPFFPDGIRQVLELLPFASMQNLPLLIYSGSVAGTEAVSRILLQIFWVIVLILAGRRMMKSALRNIVVQGG